MPPTEKQQAAGGARPPTPDSEPTRVLDSRSLRALGHPLRADILNELRTRGPATSTMLAERLGQNTGTLSWHLRLLADTGFIEEDTGRGTKRERWWVSKPGTIVLRTEEFRNDPAMRGVLDAYLAAILKQNFERLAAHLADDTLPPEWVGASTQSDWNTGRMSPDQLKALNKELLEVVARHIDLAAAHPEPGRRDVTVQIQSFPRVQPEGAADGDGDGAAESGDGSPEAPAE